jgi:hypothetical protein
VRSAGSPQSLRLGQCASLAHLDLSYNQIGNAGAGSLARVLEQCAALSHLNLIGNGSISMASKLSGEEGFKLRGVVKPLVFCRRHLALLARCHLFSRQLGILGT